MPGGQPDRDGALRAVNLGDDADTTGAIYGQIARAYYGANGIPVEWREKIAWGDEIEKLAILPSHPAGERGSITVFG
ncbi:MAG: ADP-ribosylglycohydrolase family protein [Dehalococcoidia bacterium]|nr:ADP-ribosylglycohydrolase family protein [Dehalococcoidia bacterium]